MNRGRNNKLTGQVGEFLVCTELGRRGFITTPFAGNVPVFDVLATDEFCKTVPIQVKASKGPSWPGNAKYWMDVSFNKRTKKQKIKGKKHIQNPNLTYVLVAHAIPKKPKTYTRFFILKKRDLQKVCIKAYSSYLRKHHGRRPQSPESYHCQPKIEDVAKFEDNWQLITGHLKRFSERNKKNLSGNRNTL